MRPVRRPSQARSSPVPTNPSPQITRPIPSTATNPTVSPQVQPRGVRYVDVRVAIPAESPFPQEGSNDMMQFMHPQSPSPMTVANSSTGAAWSPIPTFDGRSHATTSPFGFVPIEEKRGGRFTPPISPYTFHKPVTVSPSMMSILTEDTSETASMTIESSSHIGGSPAAFHLQQQQQQQAFHNRRSPSPSFRPKTPTGRMSPFLKSMDDDSIRKSRIKTELCMHYSSGRPCPFGAQW